LKNGGKKGVLCLPQVRAVRGYGQEVKGRKKGQDKLKTSERLLLLRDNIKKSQRRDWGQCKTSPNRENANIGSRGKKN